MPDAPDRHRLAALLREHALVRESVVLVIGPPLVLLLRRPPGAARPGGRGAVGGARLGRRCARPGRRAVGGLTLGADPLVCAVSAAAWAEGRRVTGFFVRKEAKKHGLQQWIEGPFIEEGAPVAVVDDVLTSGGSLISAVEKARQAGGVVVAALVVIDRDEGGRDAAVAALGDAPLHALFTAPELLEAGRASP